MDPLRARFSAFGTSAGWRPGWRLPAAILAIVLAVEGYLLLGLIAQLL